MRSAMLKAASSSEQWCACCRSQSWESVESTPAWWDHREDHSGRG